MRVYVERTVLDLDAPGMNGAMVRRMKQIKPHIPVLLLLSPSAKVPVGKFPLADALVLKNESPTRLLKVLDHLKVDRRAQPTVVYALGNCTSGGHLTGTGYCTGGKRTGDSWKLNWHASG